MLWLKYTEFHPQKIDDFSTEDEFFATVNQIPKTIVQEHN